tara:strand:+ start:202 stop:903 length:702 start_codon:yes stop_codon:yes gene_type:complete
MELVSSSPDLEKYSSMEELMQKDLDLPWIFINNCDMTGRKERSWLTTISFAKQSLSFKITKKNYSSEYYSVECFFNDIIEFAVKEHTYKHNHRYIFFKNNLSFEKSFEVYYTFKKALMSDQKLYRERLKSIYDENFYDIIDSEENETCQDAIRLIADIVDIRNNYTHTRNCVDSCGLCSRLCSISYLNCCNNKNFCRYCIGNIEFEENKLKDEEYDDRQFTCPFCRAKYEETF